MPSPISNCLTSQMRKAGGLVPAKTKGKLVMLQACYLASLWAHFQDFFFFFRKLNIFMKIIEVNDKILEISN